MASSMPPPPLPSPSLASPSLASPPLSVQQLLAITQALPAPLPPSTLPSARSATSPAHSSSKNNEKYESIGCDVLVQTPGVLLSSFRTYVRSVSPTVTFPSTFSLPLHGCCLFSEADVSFYLDAQVVLAAWQAVLQMAVPGDANYTLLSMKQYPTKDGVPDHTFGVLRHQGSCALWKFQATANIEFKAPGLVHDLLCIFESLRSGRHVDTPEDWSRITPQLRKFAFNTSTRDILLMDDRTAIYLRFPAAPENGSELHEYLIASLDPSAGWSDLTARELVAFMCWRSLRDFGIALRDFQHPNPPRLEVVIEPRNVEEPPSKKRSQSASRRTQSKRNKGESMDQHRTTETMDSGWTVGATITLYVHDKPLQQPTRHRSSSLDSGFNEPTNRPKHRPFCPPPSTPLATSQSKFKTTLTVSYLLSPTVAILTPPPSCIFPPSSASSSSPPSHRIVAKMFSPLSDPNYATHLANELEVYKSCPHLQGLEIPYFYGVWKHSPSPTGQTPSILLTEFITPGTTIAQLREDAQLCVGDSGQVEAKERLAGLLLSAENAMERLHAAGVLHRDLAGRNMVVWRDESNKQWNEESPVDDGDSTEDSQNQPILEDEKVVIIDFDMAKVFSEPVLGLYYAQKWNLNGSGNANTTRGVFRDMRKGWDDGVNLRNAFRF